jgi:kynurenine formamidase
MMSRRWKIRPPGSTWGDFGDDDQIGRLNLLTDEVRRRAALEIREGRCFCLSLPLDYPGGNALAPHRHPPQLRASERHGRSYFNYSFALEGSYCDCGCDDVVTLWTQYSTQWDSLAHIGCRFDARGDGVERLTYYNGFEAGRDVVSPDERKSSPGTALGIQAFAESGLQGRGVLIDLFKHYGRARHHVRRDDLLRIMEVDHISVEPGDILCLYTGFADVVLEMNRNPDSDRLHGSCAVLDGSDDALLQWIGDSKIAALVADNYAVEAVSTVAANDREQPFVPLHVHCLFRLGVPLGELWYLSELAAWLQAHRRTRFFLTAPPLRLPGAMGSPVTPVATV